MFSLKITYVVYSVGEYFMVKTSLLASLGVV